MEKGTPAEAHVTEVTVQKEGPINQAVKKAIDQAVKRLKSKLDAGGVLDEVQRLRAFALAAPEFQTKAKEKANKKANRYARRGEMKIRFSLILPDDIPPTVDSPVAESYPETPPQGLAPSLLVPILKAGLPIHVLETLQQNLDLPWERLLPMLGISKATLHRRKASGKLDPAESDRVVRFARLFDHAVDVLESVENARLWLNAPQKGLGGAVPLEYAETEVGAREVEDLLGRIEYGVYS